MTHLLKGLVLATGLFMAGAPAVAGERAFVPMTPIAYAPANGGDTQGRPPSSGTRLAAGAECPTGSGSYCSDELPYCCPGVNVDPYCAKNVNGCTE